MKIDMYTHILPPRYCIAISKHGTPAMTQVGALRDLEQRFRIMDKFDEYVQVLTFSSLLLDSIANLRDAVELAHLGNDELAEILTRYTDRFVAGVAILPMSDVDAALKETDRAIKDLGLKGVLVHSNINGKPLDSPEFMPLYEKMAGYDLPIWIHPRRDETVADYVTESESKYKLHGSLGWPYETQLAMARLVCGGVLGKYPNLKFITHHCGGGLPFLGRRLASWLGPIMIEEPDSRLKFTKEPLQYLRMFYGDTAVDGSTPALECGLEFFGADHIVFASDMPFGREQGERTMRAAIKAVTEMDITDSDRKRIFEDNAKKLLHL